MAYNAVRDVPDAREFTLKFEEVIVSGRWLQDRHIERFAELLKATNCEFDMQPPWKVQFPHWIDQVSPDRKHIQILHSCENFITNQGGHWICCYYDTQKIYVYDSLNRNKLHRHHITYIQKLFPFYPLKNIEFRRVQQQSNPRDCGVFSIAFAISILHGVHPETVKYEASLMRKHLLKIFTQNNLEHFPSNVQTGCYEKLQSTQQSRQTSRQNLKIDEQVQRNLGLQHTTHTQKLEKHTSKNNLTKNDVMVSRDIVKRNINVPPPVIRLDSLIPSIHSVSAISNSKKVEILKGVSSKERSSSNRCDKDQASKLNKDVSKVAHTSPPSGQEHASPDAVQRIKNRIHSVDIPRSESPSAALSLKEIKRLDWASRKDELNKKRRAKYEASKLNIALRNGSHISPQSGQQHASPDAVQSVKHQIDSVGISRGDSPSAALSLKEIKRLDWASRKDELNKKRRAKYAASKLNIASRNGSHISPQSGQRHAHLNTTHSMKHIIEPVCISSSDSLSVVPSLKKIDTLNSTSRKDEVNEKNDRANYALENCHKRKRKLSDDSIFDENDIYPNKKKLLSDFEAKRFLERRTHALNVENEKSEECATYAKSMDICRWKKAVRNKKYRINTQTKLRTATRISNKYKKVRNGFNTKKLLHSKEYYVDNVTKALGETSIENRMEAEKIVKWCVHQRDKYLFTIKTRLKSIKEKSEVCLTQVCECINATIDDKIDVLCGPVKKHTATSEAYFAETVYHQPLHFSGSIVINKEGQATNILPIINQRKGGISWECSSLCKYADHEMIDTYYKFLQKICECSLRNVQNRFAKIHDCTVRHHNNKLGHAHSCYILPTICKSLFIAVEFLSPHFPKVRVMKRLFYRVQSCFYKLNILENALETTDIKTLCDISSQAQENSKTFTSNNEIDLKEDSVIATHFGAFKLLTKSSMEVPRFVCISCEKLCYERDIAIIEKLRSPIISPFWKDLMKHVHDQDIDAEYVCHYCLQKFRLNKLPPTCILNNLIVGEVPEVISSLNEYEKLLIQRAKTFQIVQSMGTIAKKNMPRKDMNKKVVGRAFHLPLPIEETLKKICPMTAPLNREHELYILVRGIPTKSKIVWENLVDIKKVFKSLIWLKKYNPLYSKIVLPQSSRALLDEAFPDVEFNLSESPDSERNEHQQEITDSIIGQDNINDGFSKNVGKKDIKGHAFLTHRSQSDEYYEQFTIHPMYSDKENKTATELYQMIKVQDLALANHYKFLDLKCYPDLYPYGINGQREERLVRLTDFEYFRCKFMSTHARFRLNIQYLFYALNDNNIRQLNSGIFHKMNVTNARLRYTAGSYLEQLAKGELEGNLNTIFGRLRNTEQFWRKPRSDLNCMIQHYGPATWFLTLSPSEYLWEDLIKYLREVNPSMVHMSANSLIAADPVSVSRFMDNKFRAMLKFICSESNPIGEVTHYFWRREYQTRGTQHFHLLIWINDAPTLGESSNEEVANFISKYVTCRIPEKNISPTLNRRVTTHQYHNHNSYCMRAKKTKNKTTRACRFGFPRPKTDTFVMRDVATSLAGRRQLKSRSRLYDLPRSQNEQFVNDYNPPILCAWEGNMDIQFIGEISALLTWYCTKYLSKKEKSYVTEIFQQINSTKSLRSYLWNVGLRMLCNRECGAPEAADTLLGFPLCGTDPSTTIRWIDVNIIRSRKLKTHREIITMDSESTDIFCPSLVDYYYPTRPSKLNEISLYDFVKWWDIISIKPKREVEYHTLSDGKFLRKRTRSNLINHYNNDVSTQPEKYFFALLLLFQPWRDVEELKNGCDTYAEAFLSAESHLIKALQYHERLTEIKKNFERARELVEEKMVELLNQEKDNDECDENGIPLGCNPIEADDAMKDFVDVGEKQEAANVAQMIEELNVDQKRIFDNITEIINSDDKILRLYVSGEGGTGKSFLISTIRCWIKQTISKDTAVTAPTGIAAFNINGLTVHRLFQLPVEHGQTPKYRELSDAVLKTLRDQLQNVSLIIIDEVSMISNITLLYIHLRLTEIFNTSNVDDGWFGKKHVLLFGDLLQLPPVREDPAFIQVSTSKAEKLLDSLGSADIWASLFSYDELTINMRQRNDTSYKDMLSRIRLGIVTAADVAVLESRKITFCSLEFGERIGELCDYINKLPCDTVCLLPTCHLCDVLNESMLNRISSDEIKLVARDNIDCAPFNKKKASKILSRDNEDSSCTAGLARIITIKIGAKVMLRRNIDVTLGLVNGTIGKVVSISQALDKNDVDKIKIVLATGIEYEIERVSVKFQIMDGAYVIRKQFPLCLSYGITIHKSQGLSLNNVVIDAGNAIFSCGQVYVALSRVTSLEGLHLINYDPYSVKASELSVIEYNRLRQLYRPDLAQIKVSDQRGPKIPDYIWAVPKQVVECQQPRNHDKTINDWHVNGLQNVDGVSCYANATIQCMFNCQAIREELLKSSCDQENALTVLLKAYTGRRRDLDSFTVREFVGAPFIEKEQQDAPEFCMCLCAKSDAIKHVVEHILTTKTLCRSCKYTTTIEEQSSNILLITVPQRKKSLSLQEVIDYSLSLWHPIEGQCDHCGAQTKVINTRVSTAKKVLILQLILMCVSEDTLKLSKIHCDIKAVPTTTIIVGSQKYKVKSALFHHGPNVHEGHYTSMLRSVKTAWVNADDTKIDNRSWPRNAKDCYMLFLEQVRNSAIIGAKPR